MAKGRGSKKSEIIKHLYGRWRSGDFPDNVIRRGDIKEAIRVTGSSLSDGNIANFLKDLIRKKTVVENWPPSLAAERISARQQYGETKIFEFFEHPPHWATPFPDWHAPDANTAIYTVQSVSIDSFARDLGRAEETWLTQVAVNLHLVHTQLSLFSPLRGSVRDVRHLQMGIKTQPEIDAAFLATYRLDHSVKNMFVTVEAKGRNERILLDQIREQVAKAMTITSHLNEPPIHGIKPLALQIVEWSYEGRRENMIFLVEFKHVERDEFLAKFGSATSTSRIYEIDLEQVSCALYRLEPPIKAIS